MSTYQISKTTINGNEMWLVTTMNGLPLEAENTREAALVALSESVNKNGNIIITIEGKMPEEVETK